MGSPKSAPRANRLEMPSRGATVEAPLRDAGARGYTVDELAFATGVSSRTIRFYQFKGVLPGPARRGRLACYDGRHIERLRLIGELKDRGLSLRAVRHLLRQDSADARLLSGCLGLGENLDKPWSDDRPRTVGQDELGELLGGRAGDILQRRLGTAARELVDYFSKRAGRGFGRSTAREDIGAALDALRPLAGEAARLIFARQIERAIRERSGASGARLSPRRRRPKGRRR